MRRPKWDRLKSGLYVPPFLTRLRRDEGRHTSLASFGSSKGLWYPCCTGIYTIQCETVCTGDEAAAEYLVEIEGLASNGCGDCGDLDTLLSAGVVVTENDDGCITATTHCGWKYTHPSRICTIDEVRLCVSAAALPITGYVIYVRLGDSTGFKDQVQFYENPQDKPNCAAFNREQIDFLDENFGWGCDASGATAYVTAV